MNTPIATIVGTGLSLSLSWTFATGERYSPYLVEWSHTPDFTEKGWAWANNETYWMVNEQQYPYWRVCAYHQGQRSSEWSNVVELEDWRK